MDEQTAQACSRPAERAALVEDDGQNEAALEAEPEPALDDELEQKEAPIASDVRFGWFSPVFVLAAACLLGAPSGQASIG